MDDYFNDLSITLINLPAHRFLCIKNDERQGYFDFCDKQDKIPGQDCDTISRLLDKVEGKLDGEDGVTGQYSGHVMARLYGEDGASSECYGVRLPKDQQGLTDPFLLLDLPDGDYISFEHGPFDYQEEGDAVYQLLQSAMEDFSYDEVDFEEDPSPGRLSYYYFATNRYAKYLLPIRPKEE